MSDGKYSLGRAYTWFHFAKIMRKRIPPEKHASFDFYALRHWIEMYEHMRHHKEELMILRDKWQEYIWN